MNEFSPDALQAALAAFNQGADARPLCVALSGGLDSTALLEALCQLRSAVPGDGLRAVHVHHGLHPDADQWAHHCRLLCERLAVPLEVMAVDARPARGQSPEAKAREVRYQALRDALSADETLLTAHHADDQFETVLIQLLRGAGVAGLAGMPPIVRFGRGWHARPLLGFTRQALVAWAAHAGLVDWIHDPANEELRFARNRLRCEVLPALRAHWPAAAAAVGRSARHCAEAARLVDELAALDARDALAGTALDLGAIRRLTPARRRNLVRWHARQLGLAVPDERRLATLLKQALEAAQDTHPTVHWADVMALRHGERLWLAPAASLPPPATAREWPDPRQPLALGPGLGAVRLVPSVTGGLSAAALAATPWRVAVRRGGERLRLPGRAGSRAVKKLLQEAGLPPWLRERLPLLEVGGSLAAVGERWVDAAFWAPPGETAWRICWEGSDLPAFEEFVVGGQGFC